MEKNGGCSVFDVDGFRVLLAMFLKVFVWSHFDSLVIIMLVVFGLVLNIIYIY